LYALRPRGSHDGVVGTWSNAYEAETLDDKGAVQTTIYKIVEQWTLNADGTAARAVITGDATSTKSGTWKLDATRRTATLSLDGVAEPATLTLFDGEVLGQVILTRK
jgi:hypothetical protein